MALGTVTEFTSLANFLAAFTNAVMTGSSEGRWRYDAGGSTATANTGPGANNGLDFVHTETSGASLTGAEAAGVAEFATVPVETGRMLHLRLCIQGAFGDGTEGLEIQQRASDGDAWAMVTLITGWLYSDSRTAGETVEDFAGEDQTIAVTGGWVDFTVAIPDAATQVRLQPRYIQGMGSTWEHDIAFRSFQWEYDDVTQITNRDAGISARAGNPTAAIGAERVATGTIPVGAPTISEIGPPPRLRFFVDSPRVPIPAAFVEGGGAAYFGNLQLYFDRTLAIGLRIAPDESATFGTPLPNLTTAWEASDRALILSAGGHTVEIPGPTYTTTDPLTTNEESDTGDEPYDWLPSAAKVMEIQTWMTTFMGLSSDEQDAATLTFDDGVAPPPQVTYVDAGLSARAGNPAASIGAEAVGIPNRDAGLSARAGNPTAAIGADSGHNVVQLDGEFEFGAPTMIGLLDIDTTSKVVRHRPRDNLAWLISQYGESTRLRTLLRGLMDISDVQVVQPLLMMNRGLNPDAISGILLDWLGSRLGFPRPYTTASDRMYFGFRGTEAQGGATFGQAPFFTRRAGIEDVEPIGDATYRLLLKARARRLRNDSRPNRETYAATLKILFGNGYLDESGAAPILKTTTDNDLLFVLVQRNLEKLFSRKAGSSLTLEEV